MPTSSSSPADAALSGGSLRVAAFGVGTLAAFAAAAVVTRALGVERFGDFQTVLSVVLLVATATDLGLTQLAVREWASAEREPVLRGLLRLRVGLTAAAVLVAAVVVALASGPGLGLGALLAGAGAVLLAAQQARAVPLAATMQLRVVAGLELGRQVGLACVLVLLAASGGGVVLLLAATLPVHLALLAVTVRRAPLPGGPSAPVLRLAGWFGIATALGAVFLYAPQVVAALVLDPRDTGLFAVALRLHLLLLTGIVLLAQSAIPVLGRGEALRSVFLLTIGAAAVAGGLCALLAVPLIDLAAGADYEDAVPALRVLALALVPACANGPLGFAMLARHREREVAFVNLASALLMVAFVAVGASADGATGAAWGVLAGACVPLTAYAMLLREAR